MKSNYSAEKKIFFKELPVFVGATTQVFLALVAIIINVILHAKIWQEKRKLLDQKRREGSRNKIPSVNYIALSLLLILACVLGLVSVLGEHGGNVQDGHLNLVLRPGPSAGPGEGRKAAQVCAQDSGVDFCTFVLCAKLENAQCCASWLKAFRHEMNTWGHGGFR